MTTWDIVTLKCAVCGETSSRLMMMSTHSFGYPDLDLRMKASGRWSLEDWGYIRCPHCGYIAHDLEEAVSENVRNCVYSPAYKKYIQDQDYCGALDNRIKICLADDDYDNLLTSYLELAWAYDDDECTEEAKKIRLNALTVIDNFPLSLDEETLLRLKADLLRRTGQFDAVFFIDGSKFKNCLEKKIIQYEYQLAFFEDESRHNISEIVTDNMYKGDIVCQVKHFIHKLKKRVEHIKRRLGFGRVVFYESELRKKK